MRGNRRHKQAVSVLNKVNYDASGNPIGLVEDPTNPLSANFGTPRDPQKGRCYKGDGTAYISIPSLLTTDTIEAWEGSALPTCTIDGRLDIAAGDSVFGITVKRAGTVIGFYKMDEGSGSTCYDSSGNGNHGTITDAITLPPEQDPNSIHQYQNIKSWQNDSGYTYNLSLLVLVPKDESVTTPPFKDVQGNPLQYKGKVPAKASFVQSSCFLGDGTADLGITGLLTTDVIEVFGNSAVPSCVNGYLELAAGEKAYGVTIKRSGVAWAILPMCEPIIDPSNHTYYDISGNGNHATLINGTAANEGKQDEYHYLQKGFLQHDGAQAVPILDDGSAFADGTVLTDADALLQDGSSFLDDGTTLIKAYEYPALQQVDQNKVWFEDISNIDGQRLLSPGQLIQKIYATNNNFIKI